MTLDLPSGRYKLFIRHVHEPSIINGHVTLAQTEAQLCDRNGRIINSHIARCSASDQFKKKVGVRLAVARLIRGFPRPERALIWKRVWNLK